MKLSLPDVTLSAVTAINHELTVRAMKECLQYCSFADVVLLSSQPVDAPFRVEVIPHFSGADYAPIVCRELTKLTPSAFNLLVQYDGYIVDPRAWSNVFLEYDYIGAKWPWHRENRRVGNSGFCLRSKKLLDIMAQLPLPPTGTFVDDNYFCHTVRDELEKKYNIKIAPESVADCFAYERHTPTQPTFGFHGLFNFWRHTSDEEMVKILGFLDTHYVTSRPFAEVVFRYFALKNFQVFQPWYSRLRKIVGVAPMKEHLLQYVRSHDFVNEVIKKGEESS